MAEMAVRHERAENVEDEARGELRRVVVDVIGWGDFDHLHAAQTLGGNGMNHLQGLTRQETARLRRSCPWGKTWIDRVDVVRQVNRLAAFPRHVEGDLCGLLRSMLLDVLHGEHARAAPLGHCGSRPVTVPAADADLNQVLRMAVRQANVVHVAVIAMGGDRALVRGPEPGRRVHPLIHILLLDIDVAIDMDDADIAVDMWRDAAHIGKAEAMVAATDDGEHACGINVRHGFGYLVEGLLDIAGYDEDVARVAEVELLVDINAAVEPIAVIECGDAPYRLGAEARAGAVGRCRIEGGADKGSFVVADLADVLAEARLHEGVDAGEGGLMAAAEQRDVAVDHRVGGFKTELEGPLDLLVLLLL